MKKGIVILISFALFLSCQKKLMSESNETMNPGPIRFLALGDSYTIGEGVAESERWPNQLADTLKKRGYQLLPPEIIARTGWTTAELKAGISQANPKGPYGLVSLLIGVNNQYRGTLRGFTPENYRNEFVGLLQQAIGYAGGDPSKVMVLSIPDYSVTPFVPVADKGRVAREIDEYNAINRQESVQAGAIYIDITPISRLAEDDPSLLAADRLHPSAVMYRMWVGKIVEEVFVAE